MANVAETRVKIILTDAMSRPLKGIQAETNKTTSAIGKLSQSMQSYASMGAQIVAGAVGFTSVANAFELLVSAGTKFNMAMETNAIGMAGILTSMTTLNGKTLEWNQAMGISQGIIKSLNQDALKTAATSEELVNTFRALLGPGLGAGMNVEQIQKLTTVGVNAVKSLGLNGPQLIQELRDLVQGGIRPANSTLATALGLTDADIKQAKQSSEGLFSFLMERLSGFDQAAKETPKTLAGLQDQLKEGLTRAMAAAVKPVQDEYKKSLQEISGVLFDKNLELSPEVVANLEAAGQHVANMAEDFKTVAAYVAPVVAPAVELLGTGLGVAADNAGKLAVAFLTWKLGQRLMDIKNAGLAWTAYGQQATLAMNSEMVAAERAAGTVVQQENRKKQALKETQLVQQAYSKLIAENQGVLAIKLKMAAQYYERLGLSAEKAGRLQYQAARLAAKGNIVLAEQVLNLQEQHLLASESAGRQAGMLAKIQGIAGTVGTSVAALGVVIQSCSDDTDSWVSTTANYMVAAGMAIDGIALLIPQLEKLAKAYKGVALAKAGAGMLGAASAAIGLGVGSLAAGGYALANGLSWDEIKRRYFDNPNKTYWEMSMANTDDDNADSEYNPKGLGNLLDTKFPSVIDASKTDKSAREAERKLQKQYNNIATLQAELNRKILEDTGTNSTIALAKVTEEIAKMEAVVKEAHAAGVDEQQLDDVEKLISRYKDLETRLASNDSMIKTHNQAMEMIQAEFDAKKITTSEAMALREEELCDYQSKLQQILETQDLTTSQRLEIMKEFGNSVSEMEAATANKVGDIWTTVLDTVKNKVYDQNATIKNGVYDLMDQFSEFGQNILTESQSFSERFDNLFKNLANSIMNTMMKVIMQGLVMRSIMGLFGGSSVNFGASPGNAGMGTGLSSINDVGLGIQFANGGYATGWSIVGERGPELVNFSQPGRVYNAEQTAKALGNGAPTDVKVVIENRSGQQVQATNATAKFDGKSMILGVVIDAVRTNDGGFANILKGAVANG
ncbi:MAG: hypothetical protein ACI3WS_03330 [Phascolarctobacterium sp.]